MPAGAVTDLLGAGDLQYGTLTVTNLSAYQRYTVVAEKLCGVPLVGCDSGWATTDGAGTLTLTSAALGFCGVGSDTFRLFNFDTDELAATLVISWTPAC